MRLGRASGTQLLRDGQALLPLPADHAERHAAAYVAELEDFAKVVAGADSHGADGEDAVAALRLALLARRSAATGAPGRSRSLRPMRTAVRLAIAGGPPAVAPGRHVRWPQITDSDRAALARVLDSGELYGPNAPETVELEREWAAYVGARFALLTNSGTAALHCAVVAADVQRATR